jgi:repressor LexA
MAEMRTADRGGKQVPMVNLTKRRQEILRFIEKVQGIEQHPPTVREICHGLGLASPGSLIKHLQALEREGYLSHTPGKKRAWKLLHARPRGSLPLVGQIAAGTPILAQENREDDLPVDPKLFGVEEAFALRVRGDSMIDAHIRDGDLAVIRPQQSAESGEIVAVLVQGMEAEATLKIFRVREGGLELVPANPTHQTLVFVGPDRDKMTILGKLIGVIRPKP